MSIFRKKPKIDEKIYMDKVAENLSKRYGDDDDDIAIDLALSHLSLACFEKKWLFINLLCVDWARRHPESTLHDLYRENPQFAAQLLALNHRVNEALYLARHRVEMPVDVSGLAELKLPSNRYFFKGTQGTISTIDLFDALLSIRRRALEIGGTSGMKWAKREATKIVNAMNSRMRDGSMMVLNSQSNALFSQWADTLSEGYITNTVYLCFGCTNAFLTAAIFVNGQAHHRRELISFTWRLALTEEAEKLFDLSHASRQVSLFVYDILELIHKREPVEGIMPLLKAAYENFIRPMVEHPPIAEEIAKLKGHPTLVVSTHGLLSQIPVACLHDGERYMAERFNIVQAQMIQTGRPRDPGVLDELALRGGQPMDSQAQVRYLADDAPHHGLDEVPREIRSIKRTFGDRATIVDAGMPWTEQTLPWLLQGPGIAVVSSHIDSSRTGGAGASVIAPNNTHLPFSTVPMGEEMADVLVLAGCNSSANSDWFGDFDDSLISFCRRLGVKSIISTLWPVNDKAARIYNEAFLAALSDGWSRVQAHGHAQRVVMSSDILDSEHEQSVVPVEKTEFAEGDDAEELAIGHPYFWAAFSLSGSWR